MVSEEGTNLPWRQLHPASMLVNLLPRSLRVLRAAWPMLLILFFNREASSASLFDFLVVMVFFASTLGQTLIHFLTLRYRVNHGRLEIKTGLLNRQIRVIDPDRIQNTELARNVAHRLTGLVEVRIETASGTDVEGMLSALTVQDAEELIEVLEASKSDGRAPTEEAPEAQLVAANTVWDLIRFGATATGVFGASILFLGVALDSSTWLPEQTQSIQDRMNIISSIATVIAVVSGAWLAGIGAAVMRHYGFSLTLDGERLVAAEGLLSTRRIELRLHKVQMLMINQPWLRRLAGFSSISIETAAAREGEGGGMVAASTTVPLVDDANLDHVVHIALPSADVVLADADFKRAHPKALYREVVVAVIRTSFLVGLAVAFIGYKGLYLAAWMPVAIVAAWFDYRYQGWIVTDQLVIARRGFWNRRTAILSRGKLQSLVRSQGPIQRIWGLAHLRLRIAGTSVLLPEIALEDADQAWLKLTGKQQ